MARVPLELHAALTPRELLQATAAHAEPVGLAGLLDDPGYRARRARVPGAAIEGYRWRPRDEWSTTWWPQGVAVGERDGVPLALVSWFAQLRRGIQMGARITAVDLRDAKRPRYHHVLLVSPRQDEAGVALDPVPVHAGGIAWTGDRLFVAATFGGIREFRLSDIMRPRGGGPFGYVHVLPEFASYRPPHAQLKQRMRYSFLSLESADDGIRLVAGEYGTGDRGRLVRLHLDDRRALVDEQHVPGIPHMQGAAVHDGQWFVSASRGDREGGDLWVGERGRMTRHAGVLPPGPEDVAPWPERRQLWLVSEFPRKRWLFALDLDRWGGGAGAAAAR